MNLLMPFYPGDAFVMLAANVLAQIAVVVVLAWIISLLLARRRPAVRHAIWFSALGCVLLSPAAAYFAAKADRPLLALRLLPRAATSGKNVHDTSLTGSGERGEGRGLGTSVPSGSGTTGVIQTEERGEGRGLGTSVPSGSETSGVIQTEKGSKSGFKVQNLQILIPNPDP